MIWPILWEKVRLFYFPGSRDQAVMFSKDIVHPALWKREANFLHTSNLNYSTVALMGHCGCSFDRKQYNFQDNRDLFAMHFAFLLLYEWVEQRFSRCGSWTRSIIITWELVRSTDSWLLPKNYWIWNSGHGMLLICV